MQFEINRKPPWLRVNLAMGEKFGQVESVLRNGNLNTVCISAKCPNRGECWACGTATFMVLGDVCTRGCPFCAVKRGIPAVPDCLEPEKIAEAAEKLKLKCVVVTSVTRDDLPDGGASHWAAVVRALKSLKNPPKVEILTPDFRGCDESLSIVFDSRPDVFSHNIETVERLQKTARRGASYAVSLGVLSKAAHAGLCVKSGIMLGLGEEHSEIERALRDLRLAGVSMITIGQYIAPNKEAFPMSRWVEPSEFSFWQKAAKDMGYKFVKSGPLVRSSYRAHEAFNI